jgi:hypothetical protein
LVDGVVWVAVEETKVPEHDFKPWRRLVAIERERKLVASE